jgi:dihydroxyacid dehydratase/phosphogluconate dehydratase
VRRFRLPFNLKALSQEKKQECIDAGKVQNIIRKDIKPRDIMTREAFENAITMVAVLGGSHKCGNALNCNGTFC